MITTAASHVERDFRSNRLLQALVLTCCAVWVWAAIDPVYRTDWLLENILLFVGVGLNVVIYLRHPLSQMSCIFIAIFFILHTLGTHYTYSEMPWGVWLQEATGSDRNHYDRVVHFTFGLLVAYPVRELLRRALGLRGFASFYFTFVTMVAVSELYELTEWIVASIVSPEAGMAFLGTQGDPFDAQKDTGLALLGTVIALTATKLLESNASHFRGVRRN